MYPLNHLFRIRVRALNLLKFLTNELKIVIVAVGTSDAFHAFKRTFRWPAALSPS